MTFLLMKRPWRRGAMRNGSTHRLLIGPYSALGVDSLFEWQVVCLAFFSFFGRVGVGGVDYFLCLYGQLLLSSLWLCCSAPLFSLFSLFRRFVNPESSWVQGKRTNTRVLNKEQSIGAPLNLPAISPGRFGGKKRKESMQLRLDAGYYFLKARLSFSPLARPGDFFLRPKNTGTDLGEGCRGCAPPQRWLAAFWFNWYSAKKQNTRRGWIIHVERLTRHVTSHLCHFLVVRPLLKACLHEGGGPPVGEVKYGGSAHLSCRRDQIKMRDYMDKRVTPPKRITSPTWGPGPTSM